MEKTMELDLVLKEVISKKMQITMALDIIKEKLAYLEGQIYQLSPLDFQRAEADSDPIIEDEPEEIRPILYTIQQLSRIIRRSTYYRNKVGFQENFEELKEVSHELTAVKNVFENVTANSSLGKLKFKGSLQELCIWLDEMQENGRFEVAPARSAVISCFLIDNRNISPDSYSATKSRLKKAKEDEEARKAHAKHKEELLGTAVNQSSPSS